MKKLSQTKKIESNEVESHTLTEEPKETDSDFVTDAQTIELPKFVPDTNNNKLVDHTDKQTQDENKTRTSNEDLSSKSIKLSKKPLKLGSHQRGEIRSLFLLSSHGIKTQKSRLQDCLYLFEALYEKHSAFSRFISENKSLKTPALLDFDFDLSIFSFAKEDKLNLCLFGNRVSTLDMLRSEQAELKRLNFDKWWICDIWRGNLLKIVNEFKQQNNMDDFLFSLYHIAVDSNNASSRELLETYIEQLSKSTLDHINKAVLYALASYDVKRAIEIYLANNLFQYALCLAQLRLPSKSPLLSHVLNKYAQFANISGDYETAALCYIRLADFENGFKCLIRRNCKNDQESEQLIKNILDKFALFMPELNIASGE